jgi:SAM-dependent methyltransferase
MIERSVPADYFDTLYAADLDPWGYATSPYEKRKYAATMAALPRKRFDRGFEIGCSIGVLTRMLAARCDALLAVDISETSLIGARARCLDRRNVRFRQLRIPLEWPAGTFDLIILSEVLYYQSASDRRATAMKTLRSLRARGTVVLVHWLGETGTPHSGDRVASQFITQTRGRLRVIARRRNARYRLDVLAR